MSMTSAATHPSGCCDLETYRGPRAVLVKGRINVTRSPVRVQARVRSSTREALATLAGESSLSREVIRVLWRKPRVMSPPYHDGVQYGKWCVERARAQSRAGRAPA